MRLFIENDERLTLEGTFETAVAAAEFLQNHQLDVIFLDVRMPKISGMDFLKIIGTKYEVILITSEKEYAVEAFERNVRDYLVKPIEKERFGQAVEKVIDSITSKYTTGTASDSVFVRSEQKLVKIKFCDISCIEAVGDYIAIHTGMGKQIIHSTMKNMLMKLPSDKFIRIHRSFIVNLDQVNEIGDQVELLDNKSLPIGASYKEKLMRCLNLL